MDIKKIIKEGESETIEFKESFGRDVKVSAGAFANTRGGLTLIGVNRRGVIVGTTIGNETLQEWANEISNVSDPRLIPNVQSIEIKGKIVVIIQTKEFPMKPVAIRGRCYRRVSASNRQMTTSEISEMHLQSIGTTWDTFPHPDKKLDSLDLQHVKNYVLKANTTGRRDFKKDEYPETILHKIELVKKGKPTWASVIAFGKNPPLQAKVKCGKIRGTNTIVDDFVVDAPLLDQVDEVINYLKRVLQLSYSISGKAERDEIWEYPLEAVREAVTNAICHRDYSSPAQIQIKIFDDRFNIWNPGGLPFGMSVERLMDPNHNSVPRNTLIAMLFYDTKLIENYGSGIGRIFAECHRLGFPDPEFKEYQGGFMVTFHKDIYTEDYLKGMGLNDRQIFAILHINKVGSINLSSFKELIPDTGEKTLYRDLQDLVDREVIVPFGEKKGRIYKLK